MHRTSQSRGEDVGRWGWRETCVLCDEKRKKERSNGGIHRTVMLGVDMEAGRTAADWSRMLTDAATEIGNVRRDWRTGNVLVSRPTGQRARRRSTPYPRGRQNQVRTRGSGSRSSPIEIFDTDAADKEEGTRGRPIVIVGDSDDEDDEVSVEISTDAFEIESMSQRSISLGERSHVPVDDNNEESRSASTPSSRSCRVASRLSSLEVHVG